MQSMAADFRKRARTVLFGKWGTAIGVTLVASFLGGGGMSFGSSNAANNLNGGDGTQAEISGILSDLIRTPIGRAAMIIMGVLALIAAIYALVCFFIGGAIELGQDTYFLTICRGGQGQFKQLFSRFDCFGKALGLRVVRGLLIGIGFLLLIIPGIIMAYGFSMSGYIMADDPDCGVVDALKRSNEMMRGQRWRLFCLQFSFIGWALLVGLTCGIGALWLVPYTAAAEAAFYLEVSGQMDANGQVMGYYDETEPETDDPWHTPV